MDSFVGSIWSFGFNFAPTGWAQCNGQLLAINNYQALYALIGTTYGGDGQTTFGVPNMQGRTPIGTGTGPGLPAYIIAQHGGSETVTLTAANLPVHNHPVLTPPNVPVSNVNSDQADPTGHYFGFVSVGTDSPYAPTPGNNITVGLNATPSGTTGSGLPMNILNPYLVVNYCISLFGIFPQRN